MREHTIDADVTRQVAAITERLVDELGGPPAAARLQMGDIDTQLVDQAVDSQAVTGFLQLLATVGRLQATTAPATRMLRQVAADGLLHRIETGSGLTRMLRVVEHGGSGPAGRPLAADQIVDDPHACRMLTAGLEGGALDILTDHVLDAVAGRPRPVDAVVAEWLADAVLSYVQHAAVTGRLQAPPAS